MKGFNETVTEAVEKVIPSVVNISEVKLIRDAYLHVHPVPGIGSGFIIREDGYILTNAHVVLGSHETKVTLENGKIFSGEIRGLDTIMDLAVIRIEADGPHVPEMAKNNNLKTGNSGGPLISSGGVVIGINSAIITFAQGIGFAIPIEPAMWIAEQLMERGEVVRPWISINAVDVNPKLVGYYNLPVNKGVVITKVVPGSEANRSGIDIGDIIIHDLEE